MNKRGKWFTADNRRLWVFRDLERLGKCTTIPVRIIINIPVGKFTTKNGGTSVRVRGTVTSLNIRDDENTQYVDPMDCRYLKESIPSWFDNGQIYDSLKQNLIFGLVSYRDIKAVEVYEAYGVYYVCDGNRRLKAFQEAKARISDIKLKVKVRGDEDDLLDELRKEDPAITAFEAMQLGETVVVR